MQLEHGILVKREIKKWIIILFSCSSTDSIPDLLLFKFLCEGLNYLFFLNIDELLFQGLYCFYVYFG